MKHDTHVQKLDKEDFIYMYNTLIKLLTYELKNYLLDIFYYKYSTVKIVAGIGNKYFHI